MYVDADRIAESFNVHCKSSTKWKKRKLNIFRRHFIWNYFE